MKSFKGFTSVIQKTNEKMDMANIRNIIIEFQREGIKMGMRQDAVNDAMEALDETDGGDLEADEIYQ